MPYIYDVFISYQRQRFGKWVREHFSKFLDLYLEDALGRKAIIFIDEQIETGDIWPKNLVNALACSRGRVRPWVCLHRQRSLAKIVDYDVKSRQEGVHIDHRNAPYLGEDRAILPVGAPSVEPLVVNSH